MTNGQTATPIETLDEQPRPAQNGAVIHVAFQGVPVDLQVTDKKIGQIEQLIAGLLARGWTAPPQPARVGFGGRPPGVKPKYDDDGCPVCPVHNKRLNEREWEGRKFWSCPAKAQGEEKANKNGYCALKFDV